ncbi:hypothetical protein COCNU_scaffold037351G000030 [Cocos nucifera]|nr:hypothetical protein [Cocos nucifera]
MALQLSSEAELSSLFIYIIFSSRYSSTSKLYQHISSLSRSSGFDPSKIPYGIWTRENESLKAKVKLLEAKVKSLEAKVTHIGAQAEARLIEALSAIAAQWENELQTVKAKVVKTFHSSNKFLVAKVEFAAEQYLEGVADYKAKVQSLFPNLNLSQLDAKDEATDAEEEVGLSDIEVAPTETAEATLQPTSMIALAEFNAPAEEPTVPTDV